MRYSVTLAAAAAFLAASSAVDTVEAQDEYWHYDSPTDYFGYPIEQRYTYRDLATPVPEYLRDDALGAVSEREEWLLWGDRRAAPERTDGRRETRFRGTENRRMRPDEPRRRTGATGAGYYQDGRTGDDWFYDYYDYGSAIGA